MTDDTAQAQDAGGVGRPAAAKGRIAPRRPDTDDPHRSRERALKILFQADLRGVAPDATLARLDAEPSARAMLDDLDELAGAPSDVRAGSSAPAGDARSDAPVVDGFTRRLVEGVAAHAAVIDELIVRHARRWQISRMPVVDRTVLRLATFELLHEPTPPAVVIDEAVTLAKHLSTDDSGRYVNGVLEAIRRQLVTDGATHDAAGEHGGSAGPVDG